MSNYRYLFCFFTGITEYSSKSFFASNLIQCDSWTYYSQSEKKQRTQVLKKKKSILLLISFSLPQKSKATNNYICQTIHTRCIFLRWILVVNFVFFWASFWKNIHVFFCGDYATKRILPHIKVFTNFVVLSSQEIFLHEYSDVLKKNYL